MGAPFLRYFRGSTPAGAMRRSRFSALSAKVETGFAAESVTKQKLKGFPSFKLKAGRF
jgi:hypothetical protein